MTVFTAEKIQQKAGPEMWGGLNVPPDNMNVASAVVSLVYINFHPL